MRTLRAVVALGLFALPFAAAVAQPIPIFVSGQDRPYEPLARDVPTLVTVRGPGELRIISRARFKPSMRDGIGYAIRFRIDGGAIQEVTYENVVRSRTAMFRDGTLGVPGRLMDHRIQLRRGYHNIELWVGEGGPEVFHRTLFERRRESRRRWVALAPLGSPEQVELIVRESLVAYYRNTGGRPFEVEVIGPTELRVFTRIENTPEMRGRIQYRLQVREDGRVINTFQLSSRRSEVATYRSEDALVPGRATEIVVPVAAGRHRLAIQPLDPDKSTLLARFMLPREDLGLTVE